MSSVIDPNNKHASLPKLTAESKGESASQDVKIGDTSNRIDKPITSDQTSQKDDSDLENSLLSEHKSNKKKFPASESASDRRRFDNISYWAVGWLALAHVVVLVGAPMTFTWQGLGVAVLLHWITGSLGICLGYHRLLTHTGMKTHNWVRYVFATIGTLAGEGSPLDWVADHRKHHALSDQEGDPHSPHDGSFWSHVFWLAFHTHNGDRAAYMKRWVPDLYKEKYMRALDYLFLPLHILAGIILYGVGYAVGGTAMGASFVVWGMFTRLVLVLHATWLVNSASHMWGYRNYETTDDSRNNWLVAIVAYGEGWHNNHHAYPRMAKHGHRWYEFDITWQAVKLLRACGLVWDVVDYRNAAEKKAKKAAA